MAENVEPFRIAARPTARKRNSEKFSHLHVRDKFPLKPPGRWITNVYHDVIYFQSMIDRAFTSLLQEYLKVFPVVAVVGSRQVGKSTLVRQPVIGESRRYLTLDDIGLLSVAQTDPKGFLSGEGDRLMIDEVELAPVLLREIKRLVDNDRRPGRFLLTG